MSISTPIVQIIERDPIFVDVKQKVSDAVSMLSSARFHHLPVVNGRRLVGILSAVDMLKLSASVMVDDDSASMALIDRCYQLEDVMQQDVITVSDRATVGDAARLLSAGGFHAVPVVNTKGHLCGIVTTTDLINHMLEAPPKLELPAAVGERLEVLERVFKAAQSYFLSGMAINEHEQLERTIEAARKVA